jgi:hypothetical protein
MEQSVPSNAVSRSTSEEVTHFMQPQSKVKYTLEQAMKPQSSTLSLTSALDGVGGQRHPPAALRPAKRPGTHCIERWAPGPVWTGAENLAPTGILTPDRPTCSETLYQLSYPGTPLCSHNDY